MDASTFLFLRDQVIAAGFGGDLEWTESVRTPDSPERLARDAIYVICNSGMRFKAAQAIFERVMPAILNGRTAQAVFAHPGKSRAMDEIWRDRAALFRTFLDTPSSEILEWCGRLPHIGPITKYHLAKMLGADCAKPDVHLVRLAGLYGCTVEALCGRLAAEHRLKVASIDSVLWRACALGIMDSHTGRISGRAAP